MKLSDLLVIETGPGMAGPFISQTLGDFGATVVKINSRFASKALDLNSRVLPPGETVADLIARSERPQRSKTEITVNLKSEAGKQVLLALLERADVYVESFAPGWLERLGLSTAQFQRLNPRLIIMSQGAYGGEGPRRSQRAYAPIMTSLSGVESTVGYEGTNLPQVSSSVGDHVAAFYGIALVFAALHERKRTGLGGLLDMSQAEASGAVAGIALAQYHLSGQVPRPRGNVHPAYCPHGIYPAAGEDQWVALAAWDDAEWSRLCDALGLDADVRERFANLSSRLASREEIDQLIANATRAENRDELAARMRKLGLSCSSVLNVEDAPTAPELLARGLWQDVGLPDGGVARFSPTPWKFEHQGFRRRFAATAADDTQDVLRQLLGVADEQLVQWAEAGAFE
jgi:benzylsuccinate CoA-transferase BbsF subunit